MLQHEEKINKDKSGFFGNYIEKYPLAPLHYIIDLGSNQYMKSIIISVQVQYIDYDSIGYNLKVITDKLKTIEALSEQQFIHFLYSKSQNLSEELRQQKIKELVKSLDLKWQKERNKKLRASKKGNEVDDPKKNKNVTAPAATEDVEHDSDDEQVIQELEKDVPSLAQFRNTENETENIENELNEMQIINCVNPKDQTRTNIFSSFNTNKTAEPTINAAKEYIDNLAKLNHVDDNYIFEHLIPDEETVLESSELIAKFEYQKMDIFDSRNWSMLKYVGEKGKIIRKFMSRATAEKVRAVAVESFTRTKLENNLWKRDNEKALQEYHKYKNDDSVKLIITDKDQKFYDEIKLKEKILKEKYEQQAESKEEAEEHDDEQPEDMDEDEDDDLPKTAKRTKKKTTTRKPIVEVVFDNTLATCVTSDKGLILFSLQKKCILTFMEFQKKNIFTKCCLLKKCIHGTFLFEIICLTEFEIF